MSNVKLIPVDDLSDKATREGVISGDAQDFPDIKPTERGLKILNTANNLKALIELLGLRAVINNMTLEPEILKGSEAMHIEVVRSRLISAASMYSFPKVAIEDHLTAISLNESYHPVREWLDNGEWDGVHRVDEVISCLNSTTPELATVVIKRWLVGCVASLYEPTFKSKLVPVLHGDQSFMKTAFIERIAKVVPDAFLEGAELNPDNKDSVLSCIRSWIVELGELERSTKNSQGALKAFITREVDTVRPPYAKADIKKPRQSHFIATVNGTDFLKDETGNSRYAVIELSEAVNMEKLNTLLGWRYLESGGIRQVNAGLLKQFWLELKQLYESGYAWVLTRSEQQRTKLVADKHMDKGVWYMAIFEHVTVYREKPSHSGEWLAPKQICEYLNLPVRNVVHVGRALSLLAKEGVLEVRHLDGYKKYLIPTVQPSSV